MNPGLWRVFTLMLLLANLGLLFWVVLWPRGGSAPAERVVPPLDPALPHLELVAEITDRERAEAGGELCFSIGPLPSRETQERAEERLRPFASSFRSRQTIADSELGWTVYLPASSRAEAVSLTRELVDRGEEDFFVITSGALENMVSVGLFENIQNARSRQARMQRLGFEAQLEVRRESVAQFWVDYRIGAEDRSPWRFIVRASPGAQHREIPCWDE
ncbi:MAG: SPOR domain-containing protein [Wenzhouxiangella sp.]|nr:MAG: SPOR domain-containing protein [Wenzhouxiangella sp.]